jgi:hypothetical protein
MINVNHTYNPLLLVPRNGLEAYNGSCVASTAQYRKNGSWLDTCDSMNVSASLRKVKSENKFHF